MLFERPLKLSFVGRHADAHMLDASKLSSTLWGLNRVTNTAIFFWENGVIPKKRQVSKYHILITAPQRGSAEFFLNPEVYAGILPLLPEALQTIPFEIISQQIQAVLFRNAGRNEEADKIIQHLYGLHKLYLKDAAVSREQFYSFQLEMAKINQYACIRLVSNLGFDANSLNIHGINENPDVIDVYDAEVIRKKGEAVTGERASYLARVDGLIRHNRTLRLIVENEEEKIIAARVVDPAFDVENNIYLTALYTKQWISIQAKPIFKGNDLAQLVVLDAEAA